MNSSNLLTAMQELLKETGQAVTHEVPLKKVLKTIPNVREFIVEVQGYDPLFAEHGIDKRLKPILKYKKYTNASTNRYILHQLIRLRKNVNRPNVYGRIVQVCLNSNSFFTVGLQHIFPKGHRQLPMGKVLYIYEKYKETLTATKLEYNRVYIPKNKDMNELEYRGNDIQETLKARSQNFMMNFNKDMNIEKKMKALKEGTKKNFRPLGVPKPEGRIYMHLLNAFMFIFIEKYQVPNQHAYIPGRGTLTAGSQILSEVIKATDIYEFDIEKFFPNVAIDHVYKILKDYKVPEGINKRIQEINKSLPTFNRQYLELDRDILEQKVLEKDIDEALIPGLKPYKYGTLENKSTKAGGKRGLPQGSPLSPLLSIQTLNNTTCNPIGKKSIMYADDGLYYNDGQFRPMMLPQNVDGLGSALDFNISKSGGVKQENKGLKPLKFLGLVYDGNKDEFYSSTRKGNELIMSKKDLILAFNNRKGKLEGSPPEKIDLKGEFSGEDMIKSEIFGFIQSRMYQGKGNLEEFRQDFLLKYIKGSGCGGNINKHKKLDVFNSSSIASRSLINILRYRKHHSISVKPTSNEQ